MADKDPNAVALGRKGGKKGGPARAAALSGPQRKEIARIGAEARWRQDQIANPADYFPPEETARRFDAMLRCVAVTPPTPLCPECGESSRYVSGGPRRPNVATYRCKNKACKHNFTVVLPVIHEMSTEEMEAVADKKEAEAAIARFVILTGADGGKLSDMMQRAVRERGWMINRAGHGLMPRLQDPDVAWRRWLVLLPQLVNAQRGRSLTPEEAAALEAYDGPVTKVKPRGPKMRPPPKPMRDAHPPKPRKASAATERVARGAALCVEAGYTPEEAAREIGASVYAIRAALAAKREAGEDMGLADAGASRGKGNAIKAGRKRHKTKRETDL